MLPGLGHDRTYPQLPVSLPAREELAAAAEHSTVVGQFRALAEWLGPKGRALTPAKNIRPADDRDLIALLGTGDEGPKFHSAAELPGLNLVLSWALKARLIRRQGTRLLPVAKARPLLAATPRPCGSARSRRRSTSAPPSAAPSGPTSLPRRRSRCTT